MKRLPNIISGQRRGLFARLVANGVVQIVVMVATAWMVKSIFDDFITPQSGQTDGSLLTYAVGIAIAAIAVSLLRMWERVDAERMGQDYTHEVRTGLFTHMTQMSPRVLQGRSRGGVMLRFIGDLNALKQWVSLGVARLTVASVTVFGTLVVLALVNGPLALAVGSALAIGATTIFALGPWLQQKVRDARRRRAQLAANVSEKIASLAVLQAFGQSRRERRRLKRQSTRLTHAMVDRAKAVGVFRGVIELTAGVATGAALVVGAMLVASGATTPGTVVGAMSIVGLLIPALRDLGRVQEYRHGALVSGEKIHDFLEMPKMYASPQNSDVLADGPGRLQFDNVSAAGSINNFSAVAEPGQVIALVGPNGAGKSTVLSLAARLMDPDSGDIYLDSQTIASLNLNLVRRAIGIMTPDLPLLRGSIDKNLRYRWPDAPEQDLDQIRSLCGVDEILESFSEGGATRVSEGGANLSLGQRQRIGLARALLGNPRLLLLDEVDANLDPQAGVVLRRVLETFAGTVLLVTHRLDWVKQADMVWYIEEGKLVESGPPDVLLKDDGPTAQLFQRPRVVGL